MVLARYFFKCKTSHIIIPIRIIDTSIAEIISPRKKAKSEASGHRNGLRGIMRRNVTIIVMVRGI
ncbi:MAG: hypothetical protein ACFFAS_09750 [Promethearchaeota archaeon]